MSNGFAWGYVGSSVTGSGGPSGSVQYAVSSTAISGSPNFTFDSATNAMTVTGSSDVLGTTYASGFNAVQAIGNATTMSYDTTVPVNYNGLLFGPISIATGVTFTIGLNSTMKIKDIDQV